MTRAARCALVVLCTLAGLSAAHAQDAETLTALHSAMREQLATNDFRRPLYLESSQSSGELKGDVYAEVGQPFSIAGPALREIEHWCDILMLHLNVKGCRSSSPSATPSLTLAIGRNYYQPLADAYAFEFLYKVVAAGPDYMRTVLTAEHGPFGTSRYRIALEVVGIDSERSFLHLSYAYVYGMTAQVMMQGYLATSGRNKVGFSKIDTNTNGKPVYIGRERGVIERNTMRYYLAIEAFLGALSAPRQDQLERRLNDWYTGTERYPVQLHDLERGEYLDMKRREIRR